MRTFMRCFFADCAFPDDFAITPRDRHHDETVRHARLDSAARFMLSISGYPNRYGRHQIDAIAPDHRGCVAATWNLNLPLDVLCFAPFKGRIRGLRHSGGVRSAPL